MRYFGSNAIEILKGKLDEMASHESQLVTNDEQETRRNPEEKRRTRTRCESGKDTPRT
jgi:hypothetical protein